MHKGLFSQLFNFCFSLITAAIILVGSFHVFISMETYHNDRKNMLADYVRDALQYTETQFVMTNSADQVCPAADVYYGILSSRTDSCYYLIDGKGVIIAKSPDTSVLSEQGALIELPFTPAEIFGDSDRYFEYSSLYGFFNIPMINAAFIFEYNGNVYYVLGSMPSDGLRRYFRRLTATFIIAAAFILLIALPILTYSVMKIVRPLTEMTAAAKRFGEGDFSERVSVPEQNELGYLANSLNDMADSLSRIEEERRSFVSNVSHELKTPMTTIGGFVDGILDGTIPQSSQRHYLHIVSEEIDRLARLVRSMLNLSKYESGEIGLQTENFSVTELAARTVFLFDKRIEAKEVSITGLDCDPVYINGDIDLTQQVIYNLTENAVKFVNDGGEIGYSFEVRDKTAVVRIRNTGEGLKQNEISRVFDKFYKTDESRGKDKTGVGLGLSIVRSIIKLHNGTVLVRSVPGEYTEFEFTMPAGTQKSAAQH